MNSGRPDLRELLGVSVNASSLRSVARRPGGETALDRIGALGMATLAVRLRADREDVPVAANRDYVAERQDVVAGELSALLWHIRYGGQHAMVSQAVAFFAEWMTWRQRTVEIDRALLVPFAERVMHEWLSDRCIACGGSGKLERTRSGSWIRPRGSMQRNATFRVCTACHGSRRQATSHPARMKILGLTREQYEKRRWPQHFNAALIWLNEKLIARVHRPLTAELERRKRRR